MDNSTPRLKTINGELQKRALVGVVKPGILRRPTSPVFSSRRSPARRSSEILQPYSPKMETKKAGEGK